MLTTITTLLLALLAPQPSAPARPGQPQQPLGNKPIAKVWSEPVGTYVMLLPGRIHGFITLERHLAVLLPDVYRTYEDQAALDAAHNFTHYFRSGYGRAD